MITSRSKYPKGWEIIEHKLRDIETKLRKVEYDPYNVNRNSETLRPSFSLAHLRSQYIYDLYRRKQISMELYEFCLDHGYADRYLIAKWKESRPPKIPQNEVFSIPTIGTKRSLNWQSQQPAKSTHGSFLQDFVDVWAGMEAERVAETKKENKKLRVQEEKEHIAQEENKRSIYGDHLQKDIEADKPALAEAIKSANEKLELALQKRQRAQKLMEYADLATEWATMALKIAEAFQSSGSSELAASSYLDDKFQTIRR
ncbi:hypothetical protein C5167_045053 [Papaver somniferum]|uniref:Uncharacterized protein n=1 Tax=Papaver somniferum TaxID=3469 RepID=A0A4Y7LB81_PAPSO|nr:uncharacterized protein LOC113320449 isoform X1 [Papaver somniferum]RZC82267.1 hypothetical protein C5167_045053 [Papaver somniferum]